MKKTISQNRKWYLIDATDKILGRLATKVANLLRGKDKPAFVPHLDLGDNVVIINASKIRVTGRKMDQKIYYHYTGYPGGLREKKLKDLMKEKPEEVIKRAVTGMLPNNKLKSLWLKKLHVYAGEEHPHKENLEKIDA